MHARVILSIFLFCSTIYSQESDSTEIINSLNSFIGLSIDGKGDEAVNYLDKKSFDYYSEIYNYILYANREETNNLSLTTKYYVLVLRSYYNSNDIVNLNTREFVSKLVNDGIFGRSVLPKINYEYDIKGNNARLLFSKTEKSYYLEFNKEDNIWKLDISSLMRLGNIQFEEQIRLGLIKEEDIDNTFKEMFKTFLNADSVDYLWDPLVK